MDIAVTIFATINTLTSAIVNIVPIVAANTGGVALAEARRKGLVEASSNHFLFHHGPEAS